MKQVRRRAASQNDVAARPANRDGGAIMYNRSPSSGPPSRPRISWPMLMCIVLFVFLEECTIGVSGFVVPAAAARLRQSPTVASASTDPFFAPERRRRDEAAFWASSVRWGGVATAFVGTTGSEEALPRQRDASRPLFAGLTSIPINVRSTRLWARRRSSSADDGNAADEDLDEPGDEDEDMYGPRSAASDEDEDDEMLLGADNEEDDDDEPADVPEDWTEQDILAELGDDLVMVEEGIEEDGMDDDGDDESGAVVVAAAKGMRRPQGRPKDVPPTLTSQVTAADDDDDDDLDLEDLDVEIDIDEEDDDDDGVADALDDDAEVLAWDDDEDDDDDSGVYPVLLQEDLDDPNEMRHQEIVAEAIAASERRAASRDFDPVEFLQRGITEAQRRELDQLPFLKAVEERARALELTEQDLAGMDLDREVNEVSDLMSDDPYLPHSVDELNVLEQDVGVTDEDMQALDSAYKEIDRLSNMEPWDKVMVKDTLPGVWDSLPNQTMEEMSAALEEMGGSSYNASKWLLYDLDFNVTNLLLAAVKHYPKAPVLLQHWYPQLVTYNRYRSARDRDFAFTWEDVESADVEELRRYYSGFGYDEIPKKAPAETGMIGFEDLDEEEIKMAAFENWMTSVYNPEWDRTDFDDDDMRDEDNVFSEFYDPPQHPDLPSLGDAEDDINEWNAQLDDVEAEYAVNDEDGVAEGDEDDESREYRNMMGQKLEYDVVRDPEFERDFRGHLIVACSGAERDLDVAEAITSRFEKEFGKQVYVETRVMALAREDDNVFEVWLESYEIDLLHSKKRATSNTQDWKGPADCDDAQIDYLVDRVRFLISDDARYSYRMDLEHVDA